MKTDRRTFLASTTAAGALSMAGAASAQSSAPDLRFAVIGVGSFGMVDARAVLKAGGTRIVAVCDVDSEHLRAAADEIEKLQGVRPAEFKHYERLLDQTDLDAVVIATPPQWHALQLIAALDHGLHVYCEKPLAYDLREGRAMVDAANRSDRVVQIGFQRRQSPAFQQVKEFVAAGNAGRIVQADVQIHYHASTKDPTPQAPPASLDWDLWCGPGPKTPYSPQVGHKNWRLEKTTGHGHLVDWGIHNLDAVRWMLGLSTPTSVTAAGGIVHYQDRITTPDTLTAHFEFDQLPVVWRHRLWGATEYTPDLNNGVLLYGEEATLFVSDRKWVVIPRNKPNERQEHAAAADMGARHMENFLHAIRDQTAVAGPIDEAHRSTSTVQLGMIAYETNSRVRWHEQTEQIIDNPPATALLQRDYRAPWAHPYPS